MKAPRQADRHPGRGRASLAAAVVTLAVGGLSAGCSSSFPGPQGTASSFLSDWAKRDWAGMRGLAASPPADFTAVNQAALTDLSVEHASYTAGPLRSSGAAAHESVTQHLELTGIGTITIKSVLRLVDGSSGWRVAWTPATIAPQLKSGDRINLQVTWPPRAAILGAGGAQLTTEAPMVVVGIEGQRVKNATGLKATLVAAGAPASAVTSALTAAKSEPTWFEPVYTISQARYQTLRPTIYPIPGTVFQTIHERTPVIRQ